MKHFLQRIDKVTVSVISGLILAIILVWLGFAPVNSQNTNQSTSVGDVSVGANATNTIGSGNTSGSGNVVVHGNQTTTNDNRVDNSVTIGNVEQLFVGQGDALSEEDRETLNKLSRLMQTLVTDGQLTITQDGADRFASGAAEIISKQPLTQNVINSREFWIERGKTYNLFNSGTFIAYLGNCSRPGHVELSVGGQVFDCVNTDMSIPVLIDGQYFILRYMDRDRNGRVARAFLTISQT